MVPGKQCWACCRQPLCLPWQSHLKAVGALQIGSLQLYILESQVAPHLRSARSSSM